MQVKVSHEAAEFIRARGGKLFVWAGGACCGGTRFIESSTREPADPERFTPVRESGVTVFVRGTHRELPREIEVTLRGLIRPHVRAYWNGCAFVV